jgi:hypothetical protein
MTKDEQIEFFDNLCNLKREILVNKGDDYANKDRLSNFKDVAKLSNTTPEMVCFMFLSTKIVRLGNLLNGKEAKNESVQDSVLDLAIYADLLNMILFEKSMK